MTNEIEDIFNYGDKVITEIQRLVHEYGSTYIEAIVEYVETHDVDMDVIAEIVEKNEMIKAAIQFEFEDLHFLPRTSRLPL